MKIVLSLIHTNTHTLFGTHTGWLAKWCNKQWNCIRRTIHVRKRVDVANLISCVTNIHIWLANTPIPNFFALAVDLPLSAWNHTFQDITHQLICEQGKSFRTLPFRCCLAPSGNYLIVLPAFMACCEWIV